MKRAPAVVLLAAFILIVTAIPALAWTFGIVDTIDADSPASVMLFHGGYNYVSWDQLGSDDLWWAKWNGSSWIKTQVAGKNTFVNCYDNSQNYGPAAGFTPGGAARIASLCFQAQGGPKVKWSSLVSGTWKTSTVATLAGASSAYSGPTNVDLAFDPNGGHPNLVVGEVGAETITRVWNNGSSWQHQVLFTNTSSPPAHGPVASIAFHPTNNEPAVAYTTDEYGGYLRYITYDGTSWSSPVDIAPLTGDGTAIGAPSLAFDSNGKAWIALQAGSDTASELEVASSTDGSTWDVQTVDKAAAIAGGQPALVLRNGNPRVASYDQTDGNLRWAVFGGSSWTLSTVESANNVGEYPSVGFTGTGKARISYWDVTHKNIRWARIL